MLFDKCRLYPAIRSVCQSVSVVSLCLWIVCPFGQSVSVVNLCLLIVCPFGQSVFAELFDEL